MAQEQYSLQNWMHLGHSFYQGDLLVDVFMHTFRDNSPTMLAGFSQRRLRRFLMNLRGREDVQRLHDALDLEFSSAQQTLEGIMKMIEPRIGLPKKYHRKEKQEVQAFCNSDRHDSKRVAIGRFDVDVPAESVGFTPRNTLYATNLAGIFDEDMHLRCDSCGNSDLGYRRASTVYVYRELFEDRNRDPLERVQQIIKGVAERAEQISYKNNPNMAYQKIKSSVVSAVLPLFPEIMIDSRINYRELHRLFEWVLRKNYYLTQIGRFDERVREALEDMIGEHIKLPYGVVHARVKNRLRTIDKSIEVGWDIRDDDGNQKILGDFYGFRDVVPPHPKDEYVWKIVRAIRNLPPGMIVEEKDWITKPKRNGYSAYHFKLRFVPNNGKGQEEDGQRKGIIYSLQITDHRRDRHNETSAQAEHDTAYMARKMQLLSRVPPQVKPVVATLLGAEESYVMSLPSVSK